MNTPAALPMAEDEVELGVAPEPDGLPASHIMADVFRPGGSTNNPTSGPVSNPILVSGTGPKMPSDASPFDAPISGLMGDSTDSDTSDDWSLAPLLRQMADLHGRTVAEFQQALSLLARAFGRVNAGYLTVLHHELTRIQELTTEITALQMEVTAQALELAAERAQPAPEGSKSSDPNSSTWVTPSTRTPLPDPSTPPPPAPRGTERLASLQQDRAARWQALIALFVGM